MLIDIKRKVCLEQKLLFQLMLVRMWQTNKKTENDKVYLFRKPLLPIMIFIIMFITRKLQKSFANPDEKWTLANTINSNPISISRYELFYSLYVLFKERISGWREVEMAGIYFYDVNFMRFWKLLQGLEKGYAEDVNEIFFRDCREKIDEETGDSRKLRSNV